MAHVCGMKEKEEKDEKDEEKKKKVCPTVGKFASLQHPKKLDSGRRSKNKLKSIDIKKKCAAKNKEQEICTKNSQC